MKHIDDGEKLNKLTSSNKKIQFNNINPITQGGGVNLTHTFFQRLSRPNGLT